MAHTRLPYLQRLRDVHQLALTYLVYPGATHKRFEHSLGVMELAGRVYEVITSPEKLAHLNRAIWSELEDVGWRTYWRRVVRMAGLCHDIGHLPFSHAAEGTILPEGKNHEDVTAELILSDEMVPLWNKMTPPLRSIDVAKVAVGQEFLPDQDFSDWESLLHDIIGHDALGVDRMDYLLRDSRHVGVAYGIFDHLRLLDTIRVLPASHPNGDSPELGIESGGLYSAEALVLARFSMFMQVYYHHVRRAYAFHLQDFLSEWLGTLQTPMSWGQLKGLSDSKVLLALSEAESDPNKPGHDAARRILKRDHFRRVHTITPTQRESQADTFDRIGDALVARFGEAGVRRRTFPRRARPVVEFPILMPDGSIESPSNLSETFSRVPMTDVGHIFVDKQYREEARKLVQDNGG